MSDRDPWRRRESVAHLIGAVGLAFAGAVAVLVFLQSFTGSVHGATRVPGQVWAWGYNGYGNLGNGTTTNSSTPVRVSNLTNVVAIAGEAATGLALKGDGTVWAWGDNEYGNLGNGTTGGDSPTPVQVSNLTSVTAIAGEGYSGLGLNLIPTPSHSVAYLPFVSNPPPIPIFGFQNGGFEDGLANWQVGLGPLPASLVNGTYPLVHSGQGAVLLGNPSFDGAACQNGTIPVGAAYISQPVNVPETSDPTLTFWYHIYTQDWTGEDPNNPSYDSFSVSVGSSTLSGGIFYDGNADLSQRTTCNGHLDLGWRQGTVHLGPLGLAGKQVTFYFNNWNWGSGYYNTYTYLDDVAINP